MNEWGCAYQFSWCSGHLDDDNTRIGSGLCRRECYYYNHLSSTGFRSVFKRLPEGMQLTVLMLDGTDVRMGFVTDFQEHLGWGMLERIKFEKIYDD